MFKILLMLLAMGTVAGAEGAQRWVILKFDDLRIGPKATIRPGFKTVTAWAEAEQLPISIGIICEGLPEGSAEDRAWITGKAREHGGAVEFWCHGWDHHKTSAADGTMTGAEFQGVDAEVQYQALRRSSEAMVQATGLIFHTFGAPFNRTDAATVAALDRLPDYTVWLYGPATDRRRAVFGGPVKLEVAGAVTLEGFLKTYQGVRDPVIVLQGHPSGWKDAEFAGLKAIIARLRQDGWGFVTPSEAAARRKP